MTIKTLILPALRGRFGDWVYYSCLMPMGELGARVEYAHAMHKSKVLSELIQRSLEGPRAGHIAGYLEKTPDRFFNSLVLAVYGGSPEWLEVGNYQAADPSLKSLLSEQAQDSLGFLHLTGKEKIFAVDGQHRLAGIKRALADNKAVPEEQVSIILVGHKQTVLGLQRTRRLFTTLNKTAIPVRKRDIIALDEDDVMAITTRRMVETDPRFSEPKIALVASQNVPNNNAIALTTISSLYDILKLLFVHANGKRSDRGLRFNRPTDERLQNYYDVATSYFSALADAFKPVGDLLAAAKPETVTPKYRGVQGGHLLFRPVGLDLFTRTAIRYSIANEVGLVASVHALKKMPMDLAKAPYGGVIWDAARHVMKTDGKVIACDVMAHIAGIEPGSKSLLANYRAIQGYPRTDEKIQLPPALNL